MTRKVILLTVGVGKKDNIKETLLDPLEKSIAQGNWARVILLASPDSHAHAETLRDRVGHPAVEIRVLAHAFDVNALDTCYAAFDRIIAEILESGVAPSDISADFTRGTKVMSAALVLAATRRGIHELRYIEGDRVDGTVVPGSERIRDFRPVTVLAERRLDRARDVLCAGNPAAVHGILGESSLEQEGWNPDQLRSAAACRALADFISAWDRLDYKAAQALAGKWQALPAGWRDLSPPDAVLDWVADLSREVDRGDLPAMARRCQHLAVDLTANAERAIAGGRFEDALVRCYRVLELVGQARLFRHGYDSENIPCGDPQVEAYLQQLTGKNDKARQTELPKARADGTCSFARLHAARFLKHLGDPISRQLLKAAEVSHDGASLKDRNVSILIHGYAAVTARGQSSARQMTDANASLLEMAFGGDALVWLGRARWPNRLGRDTAAPPA